MSREVTETTRAAGSAVCTLEQRILGEPEIDRVRRHYAKPQAIVERGDPA
jgi:hypothetical protein